MYSKDSFRNSVVFYTAKRTVKWWKDLLRSVRSRWCTVYSVGGWYLYIQALGTPWTLLLGEMGNFFSPRTDSAVGD